jgi:6-phosphogluconolactonase (cycloisomerase 2 family)
MQAFTKRLLAGAAAGATLIALSAGQAGAVTASGAVFVQNDNLAGNEVFAYQRAPGGSLSFVAGYPTGGLGGQLEGSVVDHLASQGALAYDAADGLLLAVNAGSDTISVFGVYGDRLALRQILPSGGTFPVSIALNDGLVYVLNATEGGSVSGFRVIDDRLQAIPGSTRQLGLDATATPQFTNTPGQVAFSPGGGQLLVTTKANGSDVDVFRVSTFGRLSAAPTVDELPGAVPFAVTFDPYGHVLIAEAGTDALASFELLPNGQLEQLDAVDTEQQATCWVVRADGRYYASNAGSASLSGFSESAQGQLLTLFGQTSTDPGTVDAASPAGGRVLYVQAGGPGNVDEYAIESDGALVAVGSVTVPGAEGGEGIVAP